MSGSSAVPALSRWPVTREGDTITIGNGDSAHEMEITVSDEEYENIWKAIPENEEKVYYPTAPVYHEGSIVYLENQEYQITELRADTVQLLPSGAAYPIYRTESQERFEQLLKKTCVTAPLQNIFIQIPKRWIRIYAQC